MPDYKLVTAMPVVVLDDEQKLTVGTTATTTTATAELNSDASSNISSTGSTASLASTTRNVAANVAIPFPLPPILICVLKTLIKGKWAKMKRGEEAEQSRWFNCQPALRLHHRRLRCAHTSVGSDRTPQAALLLLLRLLNIIGTSRDDGVQVDGNSMHDYEDSFQNFIESIMRLVPYKCDANTLLLLLSLIFSFLPIPILC
ncbi:hypothetical protein ACLKA6_003232 [Drosophila palustris]